MFQKGLPADFRLVGATTRLPSEIPPAIRSRCLEVFFRGLNPKQISMISKGAAEKVGFGIEDGALAIVEKFAANGRDAVNMIQIASGIAQSDGRTDIAVADIEWVINSGQIVRSRIKKCPVILKWGLSTVWRCMAPIWGC